jgi:hypothetical protein
MPAVIPVKMTVTVPAIVARLLQQRLTAVTALTRTVTPIPTAMMQTAYMTLHVYTAVTVHARLMRISVTVLLTADLLLRRRQTVPMVTTMTAIHTKTAMTQTVQAIWLVQPVSRRALLALITRIVAAIDVFRLASAPNNVMRIVDHFPVRLSTYSSSIA